MAVVRHVLLAVPVQTIKHRLVPVSLGIGERILPALDRGPERLQRPVKIDLEGPLAPAGERRGLIEGEFAQAEMLHRLPLALGEGRHRARQGGGAVPGLEAVAGAGPGSTSAS